MASQLFAKLSCLLLIVAVGCTNAHDSKSKPAKVSPAKVESLPKEANLADVTLTQKAFDRLGITIAEVEQQQVSQVRQLGGEIIIVPGESAVVVAPVAGTIQPLQSGSLPKPGSAVKKEQPLFEFMPLLTPERFVPTPAERAQIANAQASLISLQMTADGDVQQSTEQVAATKITLDRAEQLQRDRVGSQREVDDARAQYALAEAQLKVAKERKAVLDKLTSEVKSGSVSPIVFRSPIDGIVRTLPVNLAQTVSTGTTLFEVVNLQTVWVRVPVYVGLLNELDPEETAMVEIFGKDQGQAPLQATPIKAPPAADPLASTADLFYSLDNQEGRFRPGERVSVAIAMSSQADSLVVPVNALLYDIHGNTWVYSQVKELTFRRVRVNVRRTTKQLAMLASGPPPGTKVVVDGAAELFGTEFGTGK